MTKAVLYALALLALIAANTSPAGEAENRAAGAFDIIAPSVSSEGALKQMQQPLLNPTASMSTLNGEREFSPSLICSANVPFLTVEGSVTEEAETALTVSIDSNLDGTPEQQMEVPQISGYCANGFVVCEPGTWDNCSYQSWVYSETGLSTETVVDTNEMRNCGCANGHCLDDPAANLPDTLSYLAAGIVTSIQTYNPAFISSHVVKQENIYSYYGQSTENCYDGEVAAAATYDGSTNNSFTESLIANDVYQLVSSVNSSQYGGQSDGTCNITRSVNIDEDASTTGNVVVQMYSQGRDYITCEFDLKSGEINCNTDGSWHRAQVQGTIDYETTCNSDQTNVDVTNVSRWYMPGRQGPYDSSIYFDYLQMPSCSNDLIGRFRIRDRTGSSSTEYHMSNQFTITYGTCPIQEVITDTCTEYENDDRCELVTERKDGILTVLNGIPTSNTLPGTTMYLDSDVCSLTVTRPFMQSERRYSCERSDYVLDTSRFVEPTENGGVGNIQIGESTIELAIPQAPVQQCTRSCKVQASSLDTSVNDQGIASETRSSSQRGDVILKQCINDACPAEPGEVVLEDCACTNSFTDAIQALQLLRLAGKDMECSDPNQSLEDCLGQIEIFKGRSASCRTAGTQTAFKGCCDLGGKIFEDQYGNPIESQVEATEQMLTMFDQVVGSNAAELVQIIDFYNDIHGLNVAGDGYATLMNWLFSPCSEDSGPAALISSNMCIKLGEHCIEEWDLVGCVQEEEVHCCFKSLLAKVLHEQARPQFPGFDNGSLDEPNCRGFTLEEFQAIDFSKVDLSELQSAIKAKSQQTIEQEIQSTSSQFINSL